MRIIAIAALVILVTIAAGAADTAPAPGATALPPGPALAPADGARYTVREKGIRALADGIYDAAERFFTEYRAAVKGHQPGYADATVLLLKTCLRQKRLAAAEEALAVYDKEAAELTAPEYRAALAYWRGALWLAKGGWNEAVSALLPLTGSTAVHPEIRGMALEGLVAAYVRLQRWPDAQAAAQRILQEFPGAPNNQAASFALIRIALAGGHTETAAQMLDVAETKPPSPPAGMVTAHRILVRLAQGNWQEAWSLYKEMAAKGFPGADEAEIRLASGQMATALMTNGKHAEAIPVLEKTLAAADVDADRIQMRLRLAECHTTLEQIETAISVLEGLRKDFPKTPEIVGLDLQLADLLRRTKSLITASEYYANVAENELATPDLRFRAAYNRGVCLREAGQFANASQAFTRAAKLGQTPEQQAEATFLAADAAFGLGSFAAAALQFQAVADTWPDSKFAEQARFNQGIARAREHQYASAAVILRQFLAKYPASLYRQEARLELGIALRCAGAFAEAVKELAALAETAPDSPLAARALLEAHGAAFDNAEIPRAIDFLSRLLGEYPNSDLCAQALYQRIHLQFALGAYPEALADCQTFIERYSKLALAADVLLWLGDYYVSMGDAARGEEYYLQVAAAHPTSSLCSSALYCAARSAASRDDLARAATLATQVLKDFASISASETLAKTEFLLGDILASQGKYREAMPHFANVSQNLPNALIAAAAQGRLAEMYYSLESENDPDNLNKAAEILNRLVTWEGLAPAELEKTRYRLGKVHEKQNRPADAIKEYLDIVYQYDQDVQEGRIRDWFYFVRGGYDAARLLLLGDRFLEAARLYERLAAAKIPTAAEAQAKAREIRKAHGLE